MHALLERSVLPAEAQAAVLARAGGNPLYAEEFARLFRERGTIDDAAMPESVQGIIAARLDLLTVRGEGTRAAAAVLGKVFWLGAVAAVSGRERWSVEQELHDLERRELIRRERRGSVEGETSTPSAISSCVTSPTARSRAASGPRSTAPPRAGSSPSGGPRTTPRCSPTTT